MVCAKCGAEIRVGNIYCSTCGKEAQIVPDYNIFEDELYQNLSQEENAKIVSAQGDDNGAPPQKQKKSKKKIIIIICVTIVCIVLAVVAGIFVSNTKKDNSYDYQMQQARACIEEKQMEEAFTYLDRALELEPESIETRVVMINMYVEEEDNTSAIVLLKEMIVLDEKNEMPYKLLLQLYEKDEAYEEIEALRDTITEEGILKLFAKYEVSEPVFSEEDGKHEKSILLEINAEGNKCEIYYTLDGTKPTMESEVYTGPMKLEEGSHKILAIAYNDYKLSSEVVSGTYEIEYKAPDTPSIQLKSGTYNEGGMIEISIPQDSEVYYTWDDTAPTKNSARYTDPISMPEGNNILSAIAIGTNGKMSGVAKKNYIYLP